MIEITVTGFKPYDDGEIWNDTLDQIELLVNGVITGGSENVRFRNFLGRATKKHTTCDIILMVEENRVEEVNLGLTVLKLKFGEMFE